MSQFVYHSITAGHPSIVAEVDEEEEGEEESDTEEEGEEEENQITVVWQNAVQLFISSDC